MDEEDVKKLVSDTVRRILLGPSPPWNPEFGPPISALIGRKNTEETRREITEKVAEEVLNLPMFKELREDRRLDVVNESTGEDLDEGKMKFGFYRPDGTRIQSDDELREWLEGGGKAIFPLDGKGETDEQ